VIILSGVLVVLAIALLVTGVLTGNTGHEVAGLEGLKLIYVSIAVSIVSALCLAIGVFVRRKELFGTGAEPAKKGAAGRAGKSARPAKAKARVGAGEEPTIALSSATATDVPAETTVYVVPGRKRYHLETCRQLAGRDREELTFEEAREEGFTPCTACLPDTALAARAALTDTESDEAETKSTDTREESQDVTRVDLPRVQPVVEIPRAPEPEEEEARPAAETTQISAVTDSLDEPSPGYGSESEPASTGYRSESDPLGEPASTGYRSEADPLTDPIGGRRRRTVDPLNDPIESLHQEPADTTDSPADRASGRRRSMFEPLYRDEASEATDHDAATAEPADEPEPATEPADEVETSEAAEATYPTVEEPADTDTEPEAHEPEDTAVAGLGHADPDHADPDHAEAEHAEPEHTEPEHTEPEHAEAEHAEAEQTVAEQTELEHADPDHAEAEQAEPEHAELEHAEPEQPEDTGPEASEPELSEPTADHDDAEQAEAAERDEPEQDAAADDQPADEDDKGDALPFVRILSGTKRYHRPDCALIEDIADDADDLEILSPEEAKERGCTPCLVCQPDKGLASDSY
jgi:hypothetical protein